MWNFSSWLASCRFMTICLQCNLYLCADLRPEPAIITTCYASFACAGIALSAISNNLSLIIARIMIFYFYSWDLLDILMMRDLHDAVYYTETLNSASWQLGFTHCLIFNFSIVVLYVIFVLSNIFRNIFYFYFLVKQHPVWLETSLRLFFLSRLV
jgi:hypothetical protein